MLHRRDVAAIVCYGVLFASVVAWAAFRPVTPGLMTTHEPTRAAMAAKQVSLSEDQPEMRRLIKGMRIP
jgi:hypothetical protein